MTHVYGKVYSGIIVAIDRVAMINVSKKIGLVIFSSTKTKVASNGERFLKCSSFHYFQLAQGDEEKEDALIQHHKSCMLLRKNHSFSAGKGIKCVNVCYQIGRAHV